MNWKMTTTDSYQPRAYEHLSRDTFPKLGASNSRRINYLSVIGLLLHTGEVTGSIPVLPTKIPTGIKLRRFSTLDESANTPQATQS
jgi:hypothetical protein